MNDNVSMLDGYFTDDRIREIAMSIGATEEETRNAITVAVPTLIGGYSRAADDPATTELVHSHIQALGGFGNDNIFSNLPQSRGSSLDDALGPGSNELPGGRSPLGDDRSRTTSSGQSSRKVPSQDDGGMLDQIFGGKQKKVEDAIGKSSGMDLRKIGPLIAVLAPIVLGALRSRASASSGGQPRADDYRDVLRQERKNVETRSGGGFLGSILDQDGDGDFDFADIMKLGMRFLMGGRR